MFNSSPFLADSHSSNQLLLSLAAPPTNLTPEYFHSLLAQYGQVQKVRIINKSLQDYQVVVEMLNSEAAYLAKRALDQLSSRFIKCAYFQEPKASFCSMETIEDVSSKRQSGSLSECNKLCILVIDSDTKITQGFSQRIMSSHKNIQVSKTICITGLAQMDATKLYNLFSNFGNIDKILYISLKRFALLKYLKEDYAVFVQQNCQNMRIFDSQINISFAAEDAIDKLQQLDTLYSEQDYFIGNEDTDRFNPTNKMTMLAPSCVLHISNLKKISSNSDTMWEIFSEFGVVEAVKVLNAQFKFMCLIKMENLQQAIEIAACMHNEEIDGRNIQISFTKAKI